MLGALGAYFLDATTGRRRRKLAVDRTRGFINRSLRRGARTGRIAQAEVYGAAKKATHLREEPKELDDVTLAHKVETELFRSADVPKGQVNINAQDGLVQLRGEVPTAQMLEDLVEKARRVQGVQDVENLLHLPDTEPRMHQ
jgi:osmotically-inducible protein OsmY